MNKKSSGKAANEGPAAPRKSKALNEESWTVESFPHTEEPRGKGFLQLCADKRFHMLIQQEFKKDARLTSREDYWIHADAGGTPKMGCQRVTPDYCYNKKGVLLMGWSAHGAGCGGFGEEVPDDVIRHALCKTMQWNVREYPRAKHFIYFVTERNRRTVVYRMICEPGSEIVCTQGSD